MQWLSLVREGGPERLQDGVEVVEAQGAGAQHPALGPGDVDDGGRLVAPRPDRRR